MNSLEALEQLYEFALSSEPMEIIIKDFKDIILKDLEVLKILKKYIYFSNKSHCIRMKDIYKRTINFDFEILKEWLENDN